MKCLLCGAPAARVLDLGPQPVAHRFLNKPGAEYLHPLRLAQCGGCALLQLEDPAPQAELAPRFPWVSYVEPEAHLDALADELAALPGLSGACGLSYKDESLLKRLAQRGVPSVEGAASLVIVRHILEHQADPLGYLESLKSRLAPGGFLVVEVPDSEKGFASGDVTTLWEEHTLYFTEATLPRCLEAAGWKVRSLRRCPYTMEDTLVVTLTPAQKTASRKPGQEEFSLPAALAAGLPIQRAGWQALLSGSRAALLGAGHRGVTFLSALGLGAAVDFIVDDDPRKRGLLLPGCQKPIRGSDALAEASLCLISANPDSEPGIFKRHADFCAKGGRFVSIYPGSALSPRAQGARQ